MLGLCICVLDIVRLCENVTCLKPYIVDKNYIMYVCVCETKKCYGRRETKKRERVLDLPVELFSTFYSLFLFTFL